MRKTKRVFTACLLATVLTLPHIPTIMSHSDQVVYADESIDDIKEKNEEREAKKKEAEDKLNSLNTEADDMRGMIAELDEEIGEYEVKLAELITKQNALQAKSAITRSDLQIARIAKENQYDRMKERIAYSYENGDISYMEALTALDDFSNALNQSEYVEQVSSYDQNQLKELIDISKEVEKKEKKLAKELAEVEKVKNEVEGERDALLIMQNGKKERLTEYLSQIEVTEGEINEYEALIAEGNEEIERMEEEYRKKQEAARKAAAERAAREEAERKRQQEQREESGSSEEEEEQESEEEEEEEEKYQEVEPSGSGWVWPCPASHYITSYFGNRSIPVAGATAYHPAIDIGVGSGNEIVAIGDGVVMYTGYSGARGNYIRVDHGGGVTSLYQHLSGFGKYGEGDYVSAGTVIAYSGMTGICSGPHLHIEIWENGNPVNPLNYIG